ncbi:MAG: c-type cytochrome [Pseudomonadales bacterium]|nr:c-type cytochrome [Pseudomonadales bacterium]
MKILIAIAIVVGIVLVAILWTVIYRNFQAEAGRSAALPGISGELALHGREVATSQGCIACHTLDGSPGIGPSWLGIYGRSETLVDGSQIVVDDAYFLESIIEPGAKLVKGYDNVMIRYFISEQDQAALLAFVRQLRAPDQQR